jgi:hypothetical protein
MFHETHLDNWRHNKKGTKLLFLARANSLMLNGQVRRFKNLDPCEGCCSLCSSSDQETLFHLTLICPSLLNERNKLLRSVIWALSSSNHSQLLPGDFEASSAQNKLLTLLGKRVGCAAAEASIAAAFQKFLLKLKMKLQRASLS